MFQMWSVYNEHEPYAAQWLRNLIKAGHIAPGEVDERSILDVRPDDYRAFAQVHCFAGLGGWSYALRRAGWPDDRPVWTGSCPCQPFSAAGKGGGFDDERHLWPAWFHLVEQRRPAVVFGEQVEASIRHGWVDLVFADLENIGYACGAAIIPAASVGAPHARHRIFFVADASRLHDGRCRAEQSSRQEPKFGGGDRPADLADADRESSVGATKPRQERSPWGGESGVAVVANGVSFGLAQPAIRALGNAIVPQAARAFIESYMK